MKEIYNYLDLTDKLSSSGMPKAEQVDASAEAGVQAVVNLATENSADALQKEQELVESRGMKYIHHPGRMGRADSPEFGRFHECDGCAQR